jgi:hypothetical protein
MRVLLKFLVFVVVGAAVLLGGAWVWAGRQAGPTIEIRQPGKFLGRTGSVELMVEAPGGLFSAVNVAVEQGGKTYPVCSLEGQKPDAGKADSADKMYVMRPAGKGAIPDLQAGPARIVVRASSPVVYGLPQAESTATRDVQVRLDPPRASVVSTFHYINLGGSEFVVYRVTPDDVESGVRVGNVEYPGYPAKGAGINSDPATRQATRSSSLSIIRSFRSHTARARSRSTTAFCSASCRPSPAIRPTRRFRPTMCWLASSRSTATCAARTIST